MTMLNISNADDSQKVWTMAFSRGVARTGIALIVVAIVALGIVSANLGSNSDSARVVQTVRTQR